MKNILLFPFLIIGSLNLTGCSTTHKSMHLYADTFPIQAENISTINTTHGVSFVNKQQSAEERPLGERGRLKWSSNYNEWTSVAIKYAENVLKQVGIPIGVDNAKVLNLSISEANLIYSFAGNKCDVVLNVSTASGYSNNYAGTNKASGGLVYLPKVACNGAMPRAVIQMFSDP